MGKIGLLGIKVYSTIGVSEAEWLLHRNCSVDIEIDYPVGMAASSDILDDTIDYVTVSEIIIAEMQKPSRLLERSAQNAIQGIRDKFPKAGKIKIRIQKLKPFIKGEVASAFVELEE